MKDNKLEVGDVLYGWGRGAFGSMFRTKVSRLTAKRAVTENGTTVVNELKNRWNDDKTLCARIVGDYGDLTLETDILKEEYRQFRLRIKTKRVIDSLSASRMTIEQCEALISLFPEVAAPNQ